LTRLPNVDERKEFVTEFTNATAEGRDSEAVRRRAIEDLFWTLFNSPEFSWNH